MDQHTDDLIVAVARTAYDRAVANNTGWADAVDVALLAAGIELADPTAASKSWECDPSVVTLLADGRAVRLSEGEWSIVAPAPRAIIA